jgi:hypothetical protein
MKVPYMLYHTENDAAEIGKGTEFAEDVFTTYVEPAPMTIEKYGSAEFTMWGWAYALGNVTAPTGTGPWVYPAIQPMDPATSLELPYFSVVSQLPSNVSTALPAPNVSGFAVALAQLGCGLESVETTLKYGPGRASVMTNVEYVGLGYNTQQYVTALPALLGENYMYASSLTMTLVGPGPVTVNYVSEKAILTARMGWKNNFILPMRYLPGSGFDASGFQVGDRLLYGVRQPSLSFTVFLDPNSPEYAALIAQNSWAVTIALTAGGGSTGVTWTYTTANFEMVETAQENGFMAVTCTMLPVFGPTAVAASGGLTNFITVNGTCLLNHIAQ